jgi:DNA-binding CsgD family transcriptional regulator
VNQSKINHLRDPGPPTQRLELCLAVLFAAIGVLACVDIATDLDEIGLSFHVVIETLIALVALTGAALLLRLLVRGRHALSRSLAAAETDAQRWRQDAEALIRGLGVAINLQFTRWALTEAERETALLLLKGLSHKEIARARGTSDATARQQAAAIYHKAGVNGRSELAAFFLEDLALPLQEPDQGSLMGP